MTYIATPKLVTILGVDFKSYLTEENEVVFSITSTAEGFGFKNSGGILPYLKSSIGANQLNSLEPSADGGYVKIGRPTLKVAGSSRRIQIVTKAELTELVERLAERGNEIAKSMLIAGAATVIQMAVDEAYGVERDRGDYISASNKLAQERREMLRAMSGRVTNPLLHCNVYAENNLLVYGDGYNRDNYDKEDADIKHNEAQILEGIQAGLKMAGMSMPEVLKQSHDLFRLRFRKQTRADIEG